MFREIALRFARSVALFGFVAGIGAAHADVVISSKPTSNMSCGDGFCEPTAANAVLNAGDLQNDIAEFGNMTVQTTGNGVEANNIVVEATFSSPETTTLNLFAHGAITVNAPVTIGAGGGQAELELESGAGGTLGMLAFGPKGHISFGSTSDIFGINGGVFTLVGSLSDLAKAIAGNPECGCALANDYDATGDGTYRSVPIPTTFTGYFEALGNTISHVKVDATTDVNVGVFAFIDGSAGFGVVRNLRLADVSIKAPPADGEVGGITGQLYSGAMILQSSVSGAVKGVALADAVGGIAGDESSGSIVSSWSSAKVSVTGTSFTHVGGLVGESGTIINSYATGPVESPVSAYAGALVGENIGSISGSFALGTVTSGGNGALAGGLVGYNAVGSIDNSYATGSVAETGGGSASDLGGLIGFNAATVTSSYSTGSVTGIGTDQIGGVVGHDISGFSDTYWDTTTSGLTQGAGNIANDAGLTGLTSHWLKSRLPSGFDKEIWKEKGTINHGFPYLIDNPPPK